MNEEILKKHIETLEANTAAMREHTLALQEQAEAIKNLTNFLKRMTEDYKSGGHIGVCEALSKAKRISDSFTESAQTIDRASKRIADSNGGRRF
jgi:sugar diacid utilization regulator